MPSLQAEAICRPHWLQAKENTCEWICSSSATMARAYLVLMTIQAVGLRLCVTQVPDLDFVVIGGGSKDALAKKGVVGYIIIIIIIIIIVIITIIITIIVIITITKPSRRSHLCSWVELDN